eukprot:CAMPEP_0119356070 /NCGR_PEP_ID=MMETSP1334-20130426/4786_1 /TAXON_ID=127549 /ORGANISM="Calcidiscus leptoporus, Strain RCC1130" /LENGTH=90 /DNA_ID=CAMNT_0007370035 /DNA_START=164 /DNA_END=432 /DNA_ORIENTATION=+
MPMQNEVHNQHTVLYIKRRPKDAPRTPGLPKDAASHGRAVAARMKESEAVQVAISQQEPPLPHPRPISLRGQRVATGISQVSRRYLAGIS